MTEAEWLGCDHPKWMLAYLKGKASDRKFRLFACACWRRHWHLLSETEREAVRTGERFADGLAADTDVGTARLAALGVAAGWGPTAGRLASFLAEYRVVNPRGWTPFASDWPIRGRAEHRPAVEEERRGPCRLLHEVFGNPWRPVVIDPVWIAANGGAAVKVAALVYEERRFDDLPILADALLDAGCDDVRILEHCRAETEHVRGCWVVDAVLGNQ